ncbi:hypothetical protein WA158_005366 [Blastocystis sp. Blastoise]
MSMNKIEESAAEEIQDTFQPVEPPKPTGQRWLVPIDFSPQSYAAYMWTLKTMKPNDFCLLLNVMNLKAPTYAHDIARNDRLQQESRDKLSSLTKQAKDKGLSFVQQLCILGEPSKISLLLFFLYKSIDVIVMGRRGMSQLKRMLTGSVSQFVLSNAPCAVCLMGPGIAAKIEMEEDERKDREIDSALSQSDAENTKIPVFLPRRHSIKDFDASGSDEDIVI